MLFKISILLPPFSKQADSTQSSYVWTFVINCLFVEVWLLGKSNVVTLYKLLNSLNMSGVTIFQIRFNVKTHFSFDCELAPTCSLC